MILGGASNSGDWELSGNSMAHYSLNSWHKLNEKVYDMKIMSFRMNPEGRFCFVGVINFRCHCESLPNQNGSLGSSGSII